ncbi:hypothetical protein G7Y89_g10102 [Cudoniella acicularis]|uniref:Epoxide hydrolase N-terminal domain-containing protein n=1 Tax=Cudoniella acicularis TaxID=354080 RepID=A0A8H4VZ23_9HELO|nr:hypothetical protein G7Y89_g10102 [Cudoniella acicularis]
MGASDSKLVFKRGIFKLSEDKAIPADDPYWASFWELPESTEDIFSLFSPADIRRTRDTALENLETLILAVTSRLFILRHHPSFPDPEFAPEKDALNCIRVLTRILPYLYEAEQLQPWEDKFFWGVRRKRTRKAALARDVLFDESQEELAKLEAAGEEFEEVKPLAEELIDTLVDLLFFADFTLPKPPNTKNKVTYAIWSSGVGCNTPVGTSREFESNRTEVLRLLLTLTSQSMYMSANLLPVQGVKAVSYIVTCPDKQVVLSVLCSLLNTALKYNPASWKIPYNVQVFKDPKLILVTYALQFLLVVLLYPIPESDPAHTKKNYKLDTSKQGIVRMCVFILQTLSVESNFGKSLNKKFENQETLPATIKLQNFNGSYADFLIHSIYNIITTSQGKLTAIYPALLAVINNVAAYLQNLSASASLKLLQLFSSMSSPGFLLSNDSNHDLLQSLLESMNAIIEHQYGKNTNFVYAILRNKKRFEALRSFTLESGQEEIERRNRRRKERSNDNLEWSDSRRGSADSIRSPSSHQRATALSDVPEEDTFAIGDDEDEDTDDEQRPTPATSTPTEQPSRASSVSSSVDDAVPTQLRGMSEKARGKMPAGMPTFSRQNSTTSLSSYATAGYSTNGSFEPTTQWIESWLPELPLHTILTLIEQLAPLLPRADAPTDTPSTSILRTIQKADIRAIEPSPIRIQYFEWSPLSLGWYESLLWSFVFTGEMQVAKGTVGVWNGTSIKLFRVETVAPTGPTLSSPRGAVDAVGSNIVSRIGSINLRGVGASSGTSDAQSPGGTQGESVLITADAGPGVGAPHWARGSEMEESLLSLPPINRHGTGAHDDEVVEAYKIHVSSKYLDLTRKKLELTRLPHEVLLKGNREGEDSWEFGTPKRVVEPLIDFWLEHYSWRTQEAHLNSTLPQYRTPIAIPGSTSAPLRIHFLHIPSPYAHAIPLLLIPTFPLTNLNLTPLFAPLTDPPHPTSTQPFHLVVPSIPGLGFSDRFSNGEAGVNPLQHTAAIFDTLMKRVGYEFYIASATGCGRGSPAGIDYYLPRLVGELFPESCLGVHLLDPVIETPTFSRSPFLWVKWAIARFFHAGIWGYQSGDWGALKESQSKRRNGELSVQRQGEETPLLPRAESSGFRSMSRDLFMLGLTEPNTFSYALCDSPVGLLSLVCSALRKGSPKHQLSNTEIIDLTQLAWLPGPEAGMRLWSVALKEIHELEQQKPRRSRVAITTFGVDGSGATEYICPAWGAAKHNVVSTQRVAGRGGLTAWERTDVIVSGVRRLAKAVFDSRLKVKPLEEVMVSGDETISEENDRVEEGHGMQLDVESPDTVVPLNET